MFFGKNFTNYKILLSLKRYKNTHKIIFFLRIFACCNFLDIAPITLIMKRSSTMKNEICTQKNEIRRKNTTTITLTVIVSEHL